MDISKVKTIFIGTSEFAVGILKILQQLEYLDIIAIVTQPDRPTGRKQELTPTPVKQFVIDQGLVVDILQPERLRKEAKEIMEKYQSELIIVASYGQIVPNSMLKSSKLEVLNSNETVKPQTPNLKPFFGCLNIHVSILPHLRGAVPMPMAILEGLSETGVTLQLMSAGLDEGDIISIEKFPLDGTETTEDLEHKSIQYSEIMLKRDLPKWIAGEVTPVPQDHSKATYCTKEDIAKEKAEITGDTSTVQAERMVRAFYPWPVAWLVLEGGQHKGKRLKIYRAQIMRNEELGMRDEKIEKSRNREVENTSSQQLVASSLFKHDGQLYLQLKDGVLRLVEVQLEGKGRVKGSEALYLV